MPEEIFIIIIVAILAGTFSGVVKQVLNYLQSRNGAPVRASSGETSMTTSELESMIQKWVGESTRPLIDRLDRIETHIGAAPAQINTAEKSILDDMAGYEASKEEDHLSARTKQKS